MRLLHGLSVLILGCLLILPAPAICRAQAQKPAGELTTGKVLLDLWNDIGRKMIALAEEFPEEKYGFRPVPAVRSFAEQARHVAFWNLFVVKTVKGEAIDPALNELPQADYPSKGAIVTVLKRTVGEAADLLARDEAPTPKRLALWVTFIEHSGEHYGQMVVYYRLNGLVPPESRPKK